ncbi:MAG TPA: BON domain-containing protein [Caulobacteraceae bacterium]|nr:BON domain-containing protein [Caulobacteraceae bacterium]
MLDDYTFRRALETELSVEPGVDSTGVSVLVRDGVATVTGHFVTLTGEVDWEFQKVLIERTARLQADVIGVVNLIKVRRRSVAEAIQERLVSAYRQLAEPEPCLVKTAMNQHMSTLSQKVRVARARRKAMSAAFSKPRAPKLVEQFAAG